MFMPMATTNAQRRPRGGKGRQGSVLPTRMPVRDRAPVGISGQRVRTYVRAERRRRAWTQEDLGRISRTSRGSVQNLERGVTLDEGTEALIEEALGWRVGSLARVRNGEEPTPLTEPEPEPEAPVVPRGEAAVDRIMAMTREEMFAEAQLYDEGGIEIGDAWLLRVLTIRQQARQQRRQRDASVTSEGAT